MRTRLHADAREFITNFERLSAMFVLAFFCVTFQFGIPQMFQSNNRFSTHYRPHVQGLRAIAILGVVLFHFGVPGLPGGFVGVDVFFVISGFLIATGIGRDHQAGDFSFSGFYWRRIKRILPASLATLGATTIVSLILLPPRQLLDYSQSALAALAYVPNIYFCMTTGYFAAEAIEQPLLHYWSLGVEEQFYLVYPALVYGVMLWRPAQEHPKILTYVLALLLALSLSCSEQLLPVHAREAFYLFPFRAFELLAGSLTAQIAPRFAPSRGVSGALVVAGLSAIAASMLGLNEEMVFPGLLAAPPCLGAVMVILGGERGDAWATRVLAARPLTAIGALSYSLYLVHWPILTFWNRIAPDAKSLAAIAAALALSLTLAAISYSYVEKPFLKARQNERFFPSFALSSAVLATMFLAIIAGRGLPWRLHPDSQRLIANLTQTMPELGFRKEVCFIDTTNKVGDFDVDACMGPGGPTVALWGDSSVAHLYHGLTKLMAEQGYFLAQLTSSACPPLVDVEVPARPNCAPFNRRALQLILERKPQTVVLGAFWPERALPQLEKTIAILERAAVHVVVLGPPAVFRRPVADILIDRREKRDSSNLPGDEADMKVAHLDARMAAALKQSGVAYLSSTQLVCGDVSRCVLAVGDTPIYYDKFHLTRFGSEIYARAMWKALIEAARPLADMSQWRLRG